MGRNLDRGLLRLVVTWLGATAAALTSVGGAMSAELATVRASCQATGQSDGQSATAQGWCLHRPDGSPAGSGFGLDCAELTYELAIANDAELAVFEQAVVRGYRSGQGEAGLGAGGEGTIVNVTQVPVAPGASAPSPTYDRPILVARDLQAGQRLFSATGRWWNRTCWNTSPEGELVGTVAGPFGEGAVVPLSSLVAAAAARVVPPPLPPVDHSGPASVTQLPTWFWVDSNWWDADYSHSARHGLVGVTVQALPRSWSLTSTEDPTAELMVCDRRGVEFHAGSDTSACTATFTTPPPSGTLELRAEAELGVSWTTTLEGYGRQALPPLYRSVDQPHAIVEVVGLRN